MVTEILRTELDYFEVHRETWLKHRKGKYAVVTGKHLVGFFTEWSEAFRAGCAVEGIGCKPFLVKQVLEHDPVYCIFVAAESKCTETTFGKLAGGQRSGV